MHVIPTVSQSGALNSLTWALLRSSGQCCLRLFVLFCQLFLGHKTLKTAVDTGQILFVMQQCAFFRSTQITPCTGILSPAWSVPCVCASCAHQLICVRPNLECAFMISPQAESLAGTEELLKKMGVPFAEALVEEDGLLVRQVS